MEKYRIFKITYQVVDPSQLDNLPCIYPIEILEGYAVQVRGALFWHTIKLFKKIRPAYVLLNHLNEKEE
jgi:hypothetical protein